MLLERVEIVGFRGINRLSLMLEQNNVLIGENAWGTSSLLDALTLLLSPEFDLYHFVRDDFWNWYYYDKEGKLLTGRQTIDGVQLYFDKNGKQVKGSLVDIDGKTYYFDKDSGAMWTNTTLEKDGKTYIIDENGVATEKVN